MAARTARDRRDNPWPSRHPADGTIAPSTGALVERLVLGWQLEHRRKGRPLPFTKSPPSPSPAFTHRAASRVGAPTKATIGPAHRLDIGFSAKGDFAARSRPHGVSVIPVCTHPIGGSDAQGRLSLVLGIFGQSFSSPIPRYGEHHV